MKKLIGIIDYELGNTQSVQNSIIRLKYSHKVCKTPEELKECTHIILPGVGSFSSTMQSLRSYGFIEYLVNEIFNKEKLFLGICVGFQILFEEGLENAKTSGLGILKGSCIDFSINNQNLLSPHCGWNEVSNIKNMKLFKGIEEMDKHFYFLHSFFIKMPKTEQSVMLSSTTYGNINFISTIELNNIFGCQFHPEKSQKNGEIFLRNFCEL